MSATNGSEASVAQWTQPTARFLVPLALAMFGANASLISSSILTLSLKANAINVGTATTILSVVVGIGAIFTVVGYPLIGKLSDLTHARIGRRRPYVLGGAALVLIGAILQASATATAVLVISYCVLALGTTSILVAASAMVPDQIDPNKRAMASTIAGMATAIGTLLGLFLSQLTTNLYLMIALPAALAVVGSLLLAFLAPDPAPAHIAGHFEFKDLARAFSFNPRRAPAFALVWLNRFLVFLGIAAVNAYQTFFLIRSLGINPQNVGQSVFMATLVLTVVSMIAAPVFSKRAEKSSKKSYIIAASVVFAMGLIMVIFTTSFGFFLVASAVMGLGQGVFFSIDFTLATEVLPDPENAAKDMGILNIANSLPQLVLAAIAPALLMIGSPDGSNFTALFIFGAICVTVGALCLIPLKERKTQ